MPEYCKERIHKYFGNRFCFKKCFILGYLFNACMIRICAVKYIERLNNKNACNVRSISMCITKCTISVKANLETVILLTYLQFTIETQDSLKRKLRTEILQKILCHSVKSIGLVSKYWLRLVSKNKSGAFSFLAIVPSLP